MSVRGGITIGTLVSVGNDHHSFARLFRAVERHASQLPRPIVAQLGYTKFHSAEFECSDFFEMSEFANLVEAADVFISHAGAGSIILGLRAGKIPIVMARRADLGEHLDNHQVELAEALASRDTVVPIRDDDILAAIRHAADVKSMRDSSVASGQQLTETISELLRKVPLRRLSG